MKDCMIDLETLGTRATSIILTIGAIKFDLKDDNRRLCTNPQRVEDIRSVTDSFYARVEIQSCKRIGMTVDQSTLKWWMQQKPDMQFEALNATPREDIVKVLNDFWLWWGNSEHPWSHGASFDVPILDNAYAMIGKNTPWKFWNTLDCRTVLKLANITKADQKQIRGNLHHHALHDCWAQILMMQEGHRRLFVEKSNASDKGTDVLNSKVV